MPSVTDNLLDSEDYEEASHDLPISFTATLRPQFILRVFASLQDCFQYNSLSPRFSDDTAVVGCSRGGEDAGNRGLGDCVFWNGVRTITSFATQTKEMTVEQFTS